MKIFETKSSSSNSPGRSDEEPENLFRIEPTEEDDPSLDSAYMSHVEEKFSENRLRSMVRKVLIKERLAPDIYKTVVRSLDRNGPMAHQELLARILGKYPMLSDEEIDRYIDSFEETGEILFDPRIQKYH